MEPCIGFFPFFLICMFVLLPQQIYYFISYDVKLLYKRDDLLDYKARRKDTCLHTPRNYPFLKLKLKLGNDCYVDEVEFRRPLTTATIKPGGRRGASEEERKEKSPAAASPAATRSHSQPRLSPSSPRHSHCPQRHGRPDTAVTAPPPPPRRSERKISRPAPR